MINKNCVARLVGSSRLDLHTYTHTQFRFNYREGLTFCFCIKKMRVTKTQSPALLPGNPGGDPL